MNQIWLPFPDPTTLVALLWSEGKQKVARVIVDIHEASHGTPFDGDPRFVAEEAMKAAEEMDFDEAGFAPE